MKKQDVLKLQVLSEFVGDFIRYWGFRKIHGEIWTVIYLSRKPLSGAEIVELLKVSKALVSPALKELETEGLIVPAESENAKTKRYSAEEDVTKIIRNVLNRREKPMMAKILNSYLDLTGEDIDMEVLDLGRLQKLGSMIMSAQMGLFMLSDADQIWG